MKIIGVAAALLLAGCATPAEIRRDGVREDFALTLPADKAAGCIRRNAQEYAAAFIVTQHESEVIVRNSDTTVAVAEIRPNGARSAATIWRKSPAMGISDLPASMAKGC